MSIEHDNLPINPRLDTLLRQIVAANDLQPEQSQRVRAQLGLAPTHASEQPTLTLPASPPGPIRAPEQEGIPMIATTRTRLRQQWLQFALAAVAFIAVGVVLALIFGSGADDQETRPGVGGSPEATATTAATPTATVAPSTATTGSQEPSVLPTPDAMGMYPGITIELAQAIVPFEILVPEPVPDGLDAPFITVIEAPQMSGEPNYRVELSFGLTGDESPAQSVQFVQRASPPPMTEVPEGMTPLGTFNGINVFKRSEPNAAGDPLITYQWQHNDVGYLLVGRTVDDLTPELLDDLLQAIFVQFTPTAESESARLLEERAELMPFPVPDTCAVTDWAGPDFRVGQQYASAYFLDGDGLTLGTTHGLLFVGDNQISWFADAPLTTSEALSGPESIRALQPGSDGATVEVPIEIIEQISGGGKDDAVERAWWSTVNFPSEGCWDISVSLGAHVLDATVYVFAGQ
jgi:hypothetical protein